MPSLTFNDGIDEEANEFHQLEAGWYTGFLSESYFKEFKSGNGTSLVARPVLTPPRSATTFP